jgi:hypothetical protein
VAEKQRNSWAIRGIISLIVLGGLAWYFFGGGIEDQVAKDAVKQYEISKKNGTPGDICEHAGLVTAAYLQAKNEEKYRTAKAQEEQDCTAAGVPSSLK